MKTINLEEILNKYLEQDDVLLTPVQHVLEAMKEACQQVLELAAENAEMKCSNYKGEWNVKEKELDSYTNIEIDKQSIIATINKVE